LVYSIVCLPVMSANYVAEQPLDVTLTSSFVVTLPAIVTFNSLPTITAISSTDPNCPGDGTGWNVFTSLKCQPSSTITLSGFNFLVNVNGSPSTPSLVLWDRTATTSILCLQPTLLNSTSITCVLPVPPDNSDAWEAFYDSLSTSVALSYSSAGLTSNSFLAGLYANLAGPSISTVSGCASSFGPLTVSGCAVGDMLTLVGTNFLADRVSVQASSAWQCVNISVVSWSMLTCNVAAPYQPVPSGQQIVAYVVVSVNNTLFTSGSFYLTLSTAAPPPSSHSSSASSPSRVVDIVVPIVVVLVVLLLAVGAWHWWRRAAVKRHGPTESGSESSSWLSSHHSPSDGASHTELGLYNRAT